MSDNECLHWCDPELHGGESTPAKFLVRWNQANGLGAYACCEDHLGEAIRHGRSVGVGKPRRNFNIVMLRT